jgi:hypothetical protein|tara:strand:- start:61 stop:615 length:555 start_codon:yes stop_codon:yes gene_type:complete
MSLAKQLEREVVKLSEDNIEHDRFLENISHIADSGEKIYRIIHFNCGMGSYYDLCKRNFPKMEYLGYASSKKAADLCKSHWNYDSFFYRKYDKLDEVLLMDTDLLVLSLDKDFIKQLENVLELEFPNVIIPSVEINLETQDELFETIASKGYEYIFQPLDLDTDMYLLRLHIFLALKELYDKSV